MFYNVSPHTPLGALNTALNRVYYMPGGRRYPGPGALIKSLPEDKRELLQGLTALSLNDVRQETVQMLVSDARYCARQEIEKMKTAFWENK